MAQERKIVDMMKAMMGDRNTVTMFRSALKSPLGSTSRTRAQKVLHIMQRLHENRDGQGGPGIMPMMQEPMVFSQPESKQPKNVVIFKRLPPFKIKSKKDGQGGPGDINPFTSYGSPQPSISPFTNLFAAPPVPSSASSLWHPPMVRPTAQTSSSYDPITGIDYSAAANPAPLRLRGGPGLGFIPAQTPSGRTTDLFGVGLPTAQTTPSMFGLTPPQIDVGGQEGIPFTPSQYQRTVEYAQQRIKPEDQFGLGGEFGGDQQRMDGSPLPDGSPYANIQEQTLRAALKAGKGPQTYGVEQAMAKTGGLPSEQYDINRKTIWDEYHIDDLGSKVADLKAITPTLEPDLQDYIRGRDEYINKTNQMINGYVVNVAEKQDMSDPIAAQESRDYLGYLYELRGRQTNTYLGYIQTAIDRHNSQLQSSVDNLNAALSEAQTTLQTKTALTTEEFNMYANAAADMYNEAINAPLRQKQLDLLDVQIKAANTGQVYDALGGINQIDYLKARNILKPGVNIWNQIEWLQKTNPEINPLHVIRVAQEGLQGSLELPGNLRDKEKSIQNVLEATQKYAQMAMETGNVVAASNAYNMADEISQEMATAFMSNSKSIEPVIKAILALPKNPSEQKFKAIYRDRVDLSLVPDNLDTAIYTAFYNATHAVDPTQKVSSQGFIDHILKNVSGMSNLGTPKTVQEQAHAVGRLYGEWVNQQLFISGASDGTPQTTGAL